MDFRVNNSDVEGQHNLVSVTPAKLLKLRVLAAIILSIMTALLFAFALLWSNKFYNNFLFEPCDEALATHYLVLSQAGKRFACKKLIRKSPYFIFRLLKYQFDSTTQCFQAMEFQSEGQKFQSIIDNKDQLTREEKYIFFGNCQLEIPIEPAYEYYFNALSGPFNLLQYFSIGVWFGEQKLLSPVILIILTAVATTVNYGLYVYSRMQLQKLANIHQIVSTKNQGVIKEVNGSELVPGDILIIKEGQQMNCDCALITGDVMVNEATLTGENIPIPKSKMPDYQAIFGFEKHNQHCLFEGTKIVKINQTVENTAIVLRTGFASLRGQYFRNVLYPAPGSKRFYIQAAKFILELLAFVFIVYFALLSKMISLNYNDQQLLFRAFDCIIWTIPPSLPIFFSICKTVSLIMLGHRGIMGSNADKVEEAGRIDTICFDKTGTLTQLGLKALKHFCPNPDNNRIANIIMACCHHLVKIDGQVNGDPLEIEMFNYVGWSIQFDNKSFFEVTDQKEKFDCYKIFEFSSERQMMSVIMFDGKQYYLLSKGSTEQISHISTNKGGEISDEMKIYASQGFRVIGLGYKLINKEQIDLQREQLEKDLTFVGLFILENPLKPDTTDVIKVLKQANFEVKVISGDNPLTTIHCAKIAGIIQAEKEIRLLDIAQNIIFLEGFNTPKDTNEQKNVQTIETALKGSWNLAMTGKLLEYLTKYNPMQNTNSSMIIHTINTSANQIFSENNVIDFDDSVMTDLLLKLVNKTKVFARQKPEQKKIIVSLLQQMQKSVMMVGDGANDCSAISQAQIGISFSESDASYTAPFSSKSTSIGCTIKVLQQGKAAIMIIIEVFQYQLTVNILKFVSAQIMGIHGQEFSDWQATYLAFLSSFPVNFFYTLSLPYDGLSDYIPNDNQFSLPNQLSMYNQMIWATLGQIINALIYNSQGYDEQPSNPLKYQKKGLINSIMLQGCLFYFMTHAMSLYVSNPFKCNLFLIIIIYYLENYYQNVFLFLWTITQSVIALVCIIFYQNSEWIDIIDINKFTYFKIFILIFFFQIRWLQLDNIRSAIINSLYELHNLKVIIVLFTICIKIMNINYNEALFNCILYRKKVFRKIERYFYIFEDKIIANMKPGKVKPKRIIYYNQITKVIWNYAENKIDNKKYLKSFELEEEKPIKYYGHQDLLLAVKGLLSKFLYMSKIQDEYEAKQTLGEGSYAMVILLRHLHSDLMFAGKCIEKKKLQGIENGVQSVQNEIRIMRALSPHSQIVNLIECYDGDNNIYLVLDLCQEGSLHQRIKKGLAKTEIKIIMQNILYAIDYIHSKGIMHRDLKPDNILFQRENDPSSLKIADFGLSTFASENPYLYPKCGTPGYVAPEGTIYNFKSSQVANLIDKSQGYSVQCDIFSCGAIFHLMLMNEPLFPGRGHQELLKSNKNCDIDPKLSKYDMLTEDEKDLLFKMLNIRSHLRPKAHECLNHNYFKKQKQQEQTLKIEEQIQEQN